MRPAEITSRENFRRRATASRENVDVRDIRSHSFRDCFPSLVLLLLAFQKHLKFTYVKEAQCLYAKLLMVDTSLRWATHISKHTF